jgi:hypothetical protein
MDAKYLSHFYGHSHYSRGNVLEQDTLNFINNMSIIDQC